MSDYRVFNDNGYERTWEELYEDNVRFQKYTDKLEKENQELKKQLEEYKEEKQEWINLLDMFKNQQKEFIEYLTSYIDLLSNKPDLIEEAEIDILEEILSKYKEIIGQQDGQVSGQV